MEDRWNRLSPSDEVKLFKELGVRLAEHPDTMLNPVTSQFTTDERELRSCIVRAEAEAAELYPASEYKLCKYQRDVHIGLRLYKFLEDPSREFTTWEAFDRHIWSYISLKLVPDTIFRRGNNELIANLYYDRPNRMILRKMWWYVHLSMVVDKDGFCDVEKTRERLLPLREQDANELMDRSSGGYFVEFSRAMMDFHSQYCVLNNVTGTPREDFFRALIREHHLRSQTSSPDLEGHAEYFKAILAHAEKVLKRKDLKLPESLKTTAVQQPVAVKSAEDVLIANDGSGKKKGSRSTNKPQDELTSNSTEYSIAEYVRGGMKYAFANNLITDADIANLTRIDSKPRFKVGRRPLLKEAGLPLEEYMTAGHYRYYPSFELSFNGRAFHLSSELIVEATDVFFTWFAQHGISRAKLEKLAEQEHAMKRRR